MEEVKIGDFSRPLVDKQESPAKARLEGAEKQLEKEASDAEKQLRPLKGYEETLKEVGVTRAEAADIVDAVIMKGYYAEDIPLTPRIKVRLRTRSARDTRRIQEYLETARPVYEAHYNEILVRMSLAASFESLGRDKYEHPPRSAKGEDIEKAFQDRLSFIESLPDPTLRLLLSKLWKFDQKVRVVLEEGAIENF